MRRELAIAAACCLALGVASGALAQGGPAMLQGEVTRRDGDVLTIRGSDGREVRVRANAQTTIRGERSIAVEDIHRGDRVHVTVMPQTGAEPRMAREIRVEERAGSRGMPPGMPPGMPGDPRGAVPAP